MKSQDIVLLLKLVSLERWEKGFRKGVRSDHLWESPMNAWQDWDVEEPFRLDIQSEEINNEAVERAIIERYSVRGLADATGISKSQVSLVLRRSEEVGLCRPDRTIPVPRCNTKALFEFIVYGLKYVFSARLGEVTRGIATSFGAPVLEEQLMSAGELVPVWPDAKGRTRGAAVTPLYKSVPYAVRRDPYLYALLALTDAIRLGASREHQLAAGKLESMLRDF